MLLIKLKCCIRYLCINPHTHTYIGDLAKVEFDQKKMREHLIMCLKNKHFSPFPKKNNKKIIKRHEASWNFPISIYCPCGRPDVYGDITQCDACNLWFHLLCENIETEEQIQGEWICMKCKRGGMCNDMCFN